MPSLRAASAIALTITTWAGLLAAQTIVPKLDEDGRRSEVARMIKEKSVAEFDKADVNKDGKLSKEEVATVSNYFANNFEKYDLNKDGFLSWEEFVGHNRWPK
jgi:Ca2+-binding EF-hand superfamily protein